LSTTGITGIFINEPDIVHIGIELADVIPLGIKRGIYKRQKQRKNDNLQGFHMNGVWRSG